MSRDRYKFLNNIETCDTEEERNAAWPNDRFAALRPLFEMFNENLAKNMTPSEFMTIDETLYPMRHQINFCQYNPNKPAKYGMLFRSVNDARFPFTYRVRVIISLVSFFINVPYFYCLACNQNTMVIVKYKR